MKKKDLIVVRGAGDLATGTIHRLKKAGFRLLVLEAEHPAAIRRQVALSEAVYAGRLRSLMDISARSSALSMGSSLRILRIRAALPSEMP